MSSAKKMVIGALFLLLFPFVFAMDCSWTLDYSACEKVKQADISESERDMLYSLLLYNYDTYPNHEFIKGYNEHIDVDSPPVGTEAVNSKYIKNAWMSFLSISPSVITPSELLVPSSATFRTEYDFSIQLPADVALSWPHTNQFDCRRTHHLTYQLDRVDYALNGGNKAVGKVRTFSTTPGGTVTAYFFVNMQMRRDHYRWHSYCCAYKKGKCKKWCHDCNFYQSSYDSDHVTLSESKEIVVHDSIPNIDLKFLDEYSDTTVGRFKFSNVSSAELRFDESYIKERHFAYDVVFDKKPYYFAHIRANPVEETSHNNLLLYNNTFYVHTPKSCTLVAQDHFNTIPETCVVDVPGGGIQTWEKTEKDMSLNILWRMVILFVILYAIYKLLKSQIRKCILPLLPLFLIPSVFAAPVEECGITNLASCIPQKIFDFLLLLINAPLIPSIELIKKLLTAEISISVFQSPWSIIRYILSFFYLLMFLYAGLTLVIASDNPIKRFQAKDFLKNTVIMIILVQGSFYIYDLILYLSSSMNKAVLSMIDPSFFLITADSILILGFQFFLVFTYSLVLFFTLLMLALRYVIVSFGVVLFPIAIFLYFIPPVKAYGRFMLHMLGIFIFVTFLDLLIIWGCSLLITDPLFSPLKILLMITCFLFVNYTLWLAFKFALFRSANTNIQDDLNQAVKYIALLA